MEQARTASSGPLPAISNKVNGLIEVLGGIPQDIIALIARLSVGAVFWQSGQTKLEGWHVSSDAVYLFQTEYKLPIIDPDRKSTRLNSSHLKLSRMPSSA